MRTGAGDFGATISYSPYLSIAKSIAFLANISYLVPLLTPSNVTPHTTMPRTADQGVRAPENV